MLTELASRAVTARTWLFEAALPLWCDRGFDTASGCFHETLDLGGSPVSEPRRARVQARQTIVFARARWLGWNGPWRQAVEAGAEVLLNRVLRPDGGTRHVLGLDGQPTDNRRDLYDAAFVLLALSEATRALDGRPDLIAAAENLLRWIETNWTHPLGGFREGEVDASPPRRQNPHMHLFEALLSLYETTGSAGYLRRADAIAALFRDKFFDHAKNMLPEFFEEDWRPAADAFSEPGHLFEWSWLLHRWRTLGGSGADDVAERLKIAAEAHGVDPTNGAVFNAINLDGSPRVTASRLWPHTERLKAHVVRFEQTRDAGAAEASIQAFDSLWRYLDVATPGLWLDLRQSGGQFVQEPSRASSFYHIFYGFSELIRVAETRKIGG